MFFILSKTLGFFAVPSNLLMAVGLVGLALLLTRFRRLASWLIVSSLVLIAFVGYSPLGHMLILPLEDRFPPWNPVARSARRHRCSRRRDRAWHIDWRAAL